MEARSACASEIDVEVALTPQSLGVVKLGGVLNSDMEVSGW